MGQWHFRQLDGYGDIYQSSSAEAFEGTALKGLATSIVRESLQNVLDVTLDKSKPARVRFTFGRHPSFGQSKSIWFDGLMHHLEQRDVGAPEAPIAFVACVE